MASSIEGEEKSGIWKPSTLSLFPAEIQLRWGCKSSKTMSGPELSSQGRVNSQFESDLSSYEAACRNYSTLQQFDAYPSREES
ncbi:hypothetical protein V6N13_100476 [Hibiscus sabdariffa]|uniref:Uncharacterized protein n=1 Tax=Hibiscus sabdariffa TaxID=183260 RepID=A0ABR2PCP2_9ROSI